MSRKEFTAEKIRFLNTDEIFVFGSNLQGCHGGGAARTAVDLFGAIWGQGEGLQGKCYAIPTMQGGVETIAPYVERFIDFAIASPSLRFLVTPIGCGIAGFKPIEIAPLFKRALDLENVILPKPFVDVLTGAPEGISETRRERQIRLAGVFRDTEAMICESETLRNFVEHSKGNTKFYPAEDSVFADKNRGR